MSAPASSSTSSTVSQSDSVELSSQGQKQADAKTEQEKKAAKVFEKSVAFQKTVEEHSIYKNVEQGRILPFRPLGL
ncbi:MAG: hypothetical protein PVI40_01170 [Chlamydiota bacterium]|jgi:hypothetical protein